MRWVCVIVGAACSQRAVTPTPTVTSDGGVVAVADAVPPDAPIDAQVWIDPHGDDDPEDTGTGSVPSNARFEKVGAPPMALTRICDLTPLGDALYMAHANSPLGTDGATIARYRPDDAKPFTVAFDWNRRGQPRGGGGAGQGFVRAHAIDGRLYVADADPPYNGLGVVERGTEGYVFISDRDGKFAPGRGPTARVPTTAGVLPRAYHVIDVIKFRGALFASAGSVPPKERAWYGPSPGALHRANADGSRWIYEVDYPFPYQNGVWRLTYMVRFRDRLYAGIQDYEGREPNDYVVIAPKPEATALTREDLTAVKVTASGAAATLRWWVDPRATPPRLYWIAWARDGVVLRFTIDGDTWRPVHMPVDAGRPLDITRFRDAIVVLAERGLYTLEGEIVAPAPVAKTDKQFELGDLFCAAPLAVFRNELYAGGQRGGVLFKLNASSPDEVVPSQTQPRRR